MTDTKNKKNNKNANPGTPHEKVGLKSPKYEAFKGNDSTSSGMQVEINDIKIYLDRITMIINALTYSN